MTCKARLGTTTEYSTLPPNRRNLAPCLGPNQWWAAVAGHPDVAPSRHFALKVAEALELHALAPLLSSLMHLATQRSGTAQERPASRPLSVESPTTLPEPVPAWGKASRRSNVESTETIYSEPKRFKARDNHMIFFGSTHTIEMGLTIEKG